MNLNDEGAGMRAGALKVKGLIAAAVTVPGLLYLGSVSPAHADITSLSSNEVKVGAPATLSSSLLHGNGSRIVAPLSDADEKELSNIERDTGKSRDYLLAQRAGSTDGTNALGALAADFQQSHVRTYAGAGFDPVAPGLVWVRFTSKPDDSTINELKALPYDVRVEWGAALSEADSASLAVRVSEIMTRAGATNMVEGPDAMSGVVVVDAVFPKTVDLASLATQVSALVPESKSPGFDIRSLPAGAVSVQFQSGVGGGRSMYSSSEDGTCTSGFGVSVGSSTGVITADHCPDYMDYNGQPNIISFVTGSTINYTNPQGITGKVDLQWHRAINGNTGASYFRSDTGTDLNVSGGQNASYGDNPCHYGVGSRNQRCGTISQLNQCETGQVGGQTKTYCGLAQTSQYVCADGDSGGPWFNGSTARGVHSAGVPSGSRVGCYYTPQTQFKPALNATLITS